MILVHFGPFYGILLSISSAKTMGFIEMSKICKIEHQLTELRYENFDCLLFTLYFERYKIRKLFNLSNPVIFRYYFIFLSNTKYSVGGSHYPLGTFMEDISGICNV